MELLSFLILISAGLFFSKIFRRLNLPYVVALIVAGIIIGPYGIGIFQADATIDFLGSIGLVFLMFMAGLEVKFSTFEKLESKITRISLLNAMLPFAVGYLIASYFGYGYMSSMMIGIIFISSSIAVIIPSLESNKLLNLQLGKSIVGATILEDVFSLILLSLVLQTINPITGLPLPVFYTLLFTSLVGLRYIIPRIRRAFFSRKRKEQYVFEQELVFIFVVLIGTVVFFELLGMHAIIAGFFTGLVLSGSIRSKILKQKLHAISYGIFIPAFFVIIGSETDITVFSRVGPELVITSAIVLGSIFSKSISGWVGAKISGFNNTESAIVGVSTIPQLSTTLAVAYMGIELNILEPSLIVPLVVLSIVTTVISPLILSQLVHFMRVSKADS